MEQIISYNPDEADQAANKVCKLLREINELKQNRSDYVLEHFVIGQHDTPGRQRLQILDELESLFFAVQDMTDERETARIEIEEIGSLTPGNPYEESRLIIRMRRAQRTMIALELQINSRVREINTLLSILSTLPEYTREQLDQEEAEYWVRRLNRQATLSQVGASTGLGEGNMEALLQLHFKPGEVRKLNTGQGEKIVALLKGEANE